MEMRTLKRLPKSWLVIIVFTTGRQRTRRCKSRAIQKDKCAYVYVHYYNNEKKKINLLSQHCNHFLTPQRRQEHCERMKVYVKDAGHTPYAACEFDECDKDLCNVPFEHGFRPALVVLISLSCAATSVALLGCICCCISCCKSDDGADNTAAKKEGGDQTNENYGKGKQQ